MDEAVKAATVAAVDAPPAVMRLPLPRFRSSSLLSRRLLCLSSAFIAATLVDVGVTVAASSATPTSMHHLLFTAYCYPASGLRHTCRSVRSVSALPFFAAARLPGR